MKATTVDVEMNIPLLKIRCNGFPDGHLRMQALYRTPCGIADASAVNLWRYKQQIEIASFPVYLDDHATDGWPSCMIR